MRDLAIKQSMQKKEVKMPGASARETNSPVVDQAGSGEPNSILCSLIQPPLRSI
jgi:hypothetical protein